MSHVSTQQYAPSPIRAGLPIFPMNDTKLAVKIDVKKLLKEHFFQATSGALYADLVLIPSKDSKFGDSHFIVQQLNKEARDAGQRGPIVGNAKILGGGNRAPAQSDRAPSAPAPSGGGAGGYNPDAEVPFMRFDTFCQ